MDTLEKKLQKELGIFAHKHGLVVALDFCELHLDAEIYNADHDDFTYSQDAYNDFSIVHLAAWNLRHADGCDAAPFVLPAYYTAADADGKYAREADSSVQIEKQIAIVDKLIQENK